MPKITDVSEIIKASLEIGEVIFCLNLLGVAKVLQSGRQDAIVHSRGREFECCASCHYTIYIHPRDLGMYFYRCCDSVPIMIDISHALKAKEKPF